MTIDLNKYAINKKFIQDYHRQHPEIEIRFLIAMRATVIHCPNICLCFFLALDIGFTPELVETIQYLIKTYDYKKILGQPKNSPFLELDRQVGE